MSPPDPTAPTVPPKPVMSLVPKTHAGGLPGRCRVAFESPPSSRLTGGEPPPQAKCDGQRVGLHHPWRPTTTLTSALHASFHSSKGHAPQPLGGDLGCKRSEEIRQWSSPALRTAMAIHQRCASIGNHRVHTDGAYLRHCAAHSLLPCYPLACGSRPSWQPSFTGLQTAHGTAAPPGPPCGHVLRPFSGSRPSFPRAAARRRGPTWGVTRGGCPFSA